MSFNANNSSQSFNSNTIAAQADAAAAVAKAQVQVNRTDAELRAAASELVRQEVIASRLNGNDKLWPHWKARQADYLAYREKLAFATLTGRTGGDVVDTETLAKGVRASMAGGELRKDGSAKGMRDGASVEVKPTDRPRVIPLPNGGLLDTHTSVTISKASAAKLGYVEQRGEKK